MRRFRCYDCGHQFQVAYGLGGPGARMTCPNCGGSNIHRAENDRGFARTGRGWGLSSIGRRRSGLGRAPRWAQ